MKRGPKNLEKKTCILYSVIVNYITMHKVKEGSSQPAKGKIPAEKSKRSYKRR
jgi:hypothetical protein